MWVIGACVCVCVHSCLTKSLPFSRCFLRGRHEIIHQLCHLFLEKHHYVLLSMRRDSLKNQLERIISSRQTQLILKFMMRFHRVQRAQFIIFFTKLMNCDARGRRERDDVERRSEQDEEEFHMTSSSTLFLFKKTLLIWENVRECVDTMQHYAWPHRNETMCHRCLFFLISLNYLVCASKTQ